MKKTAWIIAITLLLALFIFYTGFIPYTVERKFKAPVKNTRVLEFINSPSEIVKWHLPFARKDTGGKNLNILSDKITLNDSYVEISPSNLMETVFVSGTGNKSKTFIFQVVPDSNNAERSNVSLIYKTTRLDHWLGFNKVQANARKSFDNLRKLLENPKKVYGFEIEKIIVTDTAFLFSSSTVTIQDFQKASEELFTSLINYAKEKNAGYNGVRIFHSEKISPTEVNLFAGIGVTRRINSKPTDSILYKLMPGGKNLLAAYFEGPYRDVSKAYTALELYKKDHSLVSIAMPFEKFITDGYAFADTQVVKISVRYPIF